MPPLRLHRRVVEVFDRSALLMADQSIPVAEHTALIHELTAHVPDLGLIQAARWHLSRRIRNGRRFREPNDHLYCSL
jgi:hypothetical protein